MYEQQHNLVELSYSGLQTGDELPGSDFLTNTTLTYAGAALAGQHAELNVQRVLDVLRDPELKPRLDFAALQKSCRASLNSNRLPATCSITVWCCSPTSPVCEAT